MKENVVLKVQKLFDSEKFNEADIILERLSENERCARWHYMKGVALAGKGWHHGSQKYIEKARKLDPENEEYRKNVEVAIIPRFDGTERPFSLCRSRTIDDGDARDAYWTMRLLGCC